MKYFYYPGCSLEGTAREYNASTRAVMGAVGAELMELEDWTCCGASAGDTASGLLAMVLPARNLAMAERTGIVADLLVPCSACYLNLKKVEEQARGDDRLAAKINQVLGEEGRAYSGKIRVRHLLDVLVGDVGSDRITPLVQHPLSGLRVAPYYGCQCLRPYRVFDDPEQPRSMEPLIESLGAQVHPWSMGARCCGAGLMTTKNDVAMELVGQLLLAARGADCIVTVCPMCQMNLEAFQKRVSGTHGEDLSISVLYLPQLMGFALGLPAEALQLNLTLAFTAALQAKLL